MRRSVSIAGLAAALVLGMGAFGTGQKSSVASAQEKTSTMEVKIDNFSFGPVTLTVLDTDEKFSFTFSKAGTYPYFCSIHPKMTGKVIVQ
jgi:plastocyanin